MARTGCINLQYPMLQDIEGVWAQGKFTIVQSRPQVVDAPST